MTLIKSLLLGSAAGLVTIAAAQAADLPTKKGAPAAEYVKVCSITVGGKPIVGFTLPGSDTCIRFSGYITGQVEAGNLTTGYALNYAPKGTSAAAGTQSATGTDGRDAYGYTTRFNFTVDAVSNTAYGPLAAHGEFQFNHGEGFANTGQGGSDGGLNRAYVTWAGLTAGKANSFFSFTGGGPAWNNFFSADRQGYDQPDLLAYTASFGGGFTATLSLEDGSGSKAGGFSGSGTGQYGDSVGSNTYLGARSPDIVGSLDYSAGWGRAHLAGVAHQDRVMDTLSSATLAKWGYGVTAGVSINLPSLGAGDEIDLFGQLGQGAQMYGGIWDGMWGGAVNGNGQFLALSDYYYNGTSWQTSTVWSVTGDLVHHFSPEFTLSLEGSYGAVNWNNNTAVSEVSNGTAYLAGLVMNYDPVKNLDFEFELLYENTHSKTPSGFVPTVAVPTFHTTSSGFAGRFEVTRSF